LNIRILGFLVPRLEKTWSEVEIGGKKLVDFYNHQYPYSALDALPPAIFERRLEQNINPKMKKVA
jgi:transposase InsO family protein